MQTSKHFFIFRQLVRLGIVLALSSCHVLFGYTRDPLASSLVNQLVTASDKGASVAEARLLALKDGALPDICDRFPNESTIGKARLFKAGLAIGSPDGLIVRLFQMALSDENNGIRHRAAFEAGKFPHLASDLAPILRTLFNDPLNPIRATAIAVVAAYPSSYSLTDDEVVIFSLDPQPLVQAQAAAVMAVRDVSTFQRTRPKVVLALVKSLRDRLPEVRAAAAYALGLFARNTSGIEKYLRAFVTRETVPVVRLQGALALLKVGSRSAREAAMPVLVQLSEGNDKSVRELAQSLLRNNGRNASRE